MAKFGVGQSVRRVEDQRFITGTGRYTDDISLDNQAYGVAVRSPEAHARIRRIDADAAKAAPGVLANDTDPDNDRLTIVSVTQGARGTVTIENGRVRYVAREGYVGPDQFTYTISDGRGGMATAIVYIDVRDC
ncbi:xanthine dehydrogenase family protein molybdopterin-binding subunit [bacterium]|nr:xanthine dehydrogenase family protein molybdopterin-binding subunit [bacterium]